MHVNRYVIQVDLPMTIWIPYYLGQPRNEFKGNRLVGELGKVNPVVTIYQFNVMLKS